MDFPLAQPYSPPVAELLEFGFPAADRDYSEPLGLTPDHVPELIRMACDPGLNDGDCDGEEVWGSVHAWRALGEMRAADAVEPLVALLETIVDDDWSADLARSIGRLGAPVLRHLLALACDPGRAADLRTLATRGLAGIPPGEPESHAEAVTALMQLVELDPDPDVVVGAVNGLLDLKAVQAAPAIERALADGRLDASACGDWEDVQIELGLLQERLTPPPPNLLDRMIEKDYADDPVGAARMRKIFGDPELLAAVLAAELVRSGPAELASLRHAPPRGARESAPAPKRAGTSAAARRKMARQSRRKNRKRR
jgi:hypothetical protein